MNTTIAFIGAGKMASAIVKGLIAHGFDAQRIVCTCGEDPTGPALAAETGIHFEKELPALLSKADVVVLACKPQQLGDIVLPALPQKQLFLSILAGVTLEKLASKLHGARNIVRAMPNLPGQIGKGVTAYAPLTPLADGDRATVELILGSLGQVLSLPESSLDAVTAVSGSGPAYVFEFAAALRAAAEACGLDAAVAKALVMATLEGSLALMEKSPLSPDALRDAVTSKGGTTAAALAVLKEANFRALVEKALLAAQRRSAELSKL